MNTRDGNVNDLRSVFNFSSELYIVWQKFYTLENYTCTYLLTTNWERGYFQVEDKTNSTRFQVDLYFDRENEFEEVALWITTDKYV